MYGGVYYRDCVYCFLNIWVKYGKFFKFVFNINIILICYIL